jgi:hypothetical protein
LTGVTVSNTPRKAEKPMSEIMDGKKAKARIKRYGFAYCMEGELSRKTADNTVSGLKNVRGVPISAIRIPIKSAWHTASCSPSLLPFAFSVETSVAVTKM